MLGTTPGISKGMASAWPGDKESMPGAGHHDCCGPKPGAAWRFSQHQYRSQCMAGRATRATASWAASHQATQDSQAWASKSHKADAAALQPVSLPPCGALRYTSSAV